MANNEPKLSSALLAAQQKLITLRQQQRAGAGRIASRSIGYPGTLWGNRPPPSLPRLDQSLPAHLGWVSASVSVVLRRSAQSPKPDGSRHKTRHPSALRSLASQQSLHSAQAKERPIKLYPDLALAILRQEKAAAARIWLLLRHLDIEGSGWIRLEDARLLLTAKDAAFRVCGRRQLRNLLSQGEGLFWLRDEDRIWLRSVAKVAAALGVRQLTGRPVAISPTILTQRIGAVRAHLYASFHSGRTVKRGRRDHESKPITRKTIQDLCGASRRTQRNYEKRARVRSKPNFAIGPHATTADEKETAWHRGRAIFRLTDERGKRGSPGRVYLAWQLPNSYFGPHATQPRGRQKRINQELKDLFMQGMTGNDEDLVAAGTISPTTRFYGSGRQAAKAYNRQGDQSIYWRSLEQFQSNRARIWHFLPARSDAI